MKPLILFLLISSPIKTYNGPQFAKIELPNRYIRLDTYKNTQYMNIFEWHDYSRVVIPDSSKLLLLDASWNNNRNCKVSWEVPDNISCIICEDKLIMKPEACIIILHIDKNGEHSKIVMNFIDKSNNNGKLNNVERKND